ncbi:Uveal autoantigen with coiled-coil domains and ankyrin repeats, partial [Nibea albiflora]
QLFHLPAKKNIETVLEDYANYKKSKGNSDNKEYAVNEVVAGIREYFNVMLGTQLLYKFERPQYAEILAEHPDMPMSQMYGAPHLLRLFVRIGAMLAYTPLDEKSLALLLSYLQDFLKLDECLSLLCQKHKNTDWNKYDDRLMKAVERGEVDKVAAVLSKKGIIPTKLDVEGRSAFHLAATRGHLDCLNVILGHNVDVTATDATGKNALHLSSRNGHSLCVQKLLQDGRTPLVLATQMCHPRICQLLLERGANITTRDKQSKTALILGCEYGCKDAVEVLLKSGADVKAVDGLGHDAFHYSRLSKNPELVSMVKSYLDKAARDKEAAKIEQWKRQDLERQNETLQENLIKYRQEQRVLLDKVNILQQQLTQKEQLKVLLSAKEREDGARGQETVKVQLRSTLVKRTRWSNKLSAWIQNRRILPYRVHCPDLQRRVMPLWDGTSPVNWTHSGMKTRQSREDNRQRRKRMARLQSALNRKNRECQELVQSRDTIQKQADQQVQELEDALGDVQKRMLDSECKVKQLQAHVVAVKEHLGGQAAEELRAQLQDVKAKYEGASAEVGRVRNRLKQSEKALEEYKSSESHLAA